jgi:hypothetical protein
MLRNILIKHHSFPGFALLLGSLLQYTKAENPYALLPEMISFLYLGRQRGEGYIFDDTGFSGLMTIHSHTGALEKTGTLEFLTYFAKLLENPERSETLVFNQQRYTTASKECLQLCLCNHQNFTKRAWESAHRDKALRRSKPSVWRRRLGVNSRIRKSRHQLKVLQQGLLKARITINQYASFPDNSPEHEYCRSLSYRWSLDLLPSLLEKSAVSLELAEVLHGCTFTTMGQKFPRRMTLAKEAIAKYLLLNVSGVCEL